MFKYSSVFCSKYNLAISIIKRKVPVGSLFSHSIVTTTWNTHHHHHHYKHQGLDPLNRSVSEVTTAFSNVSSVFQLFFFLVICTSMISKGFGFVAFFEILKRFNLRNKTGFLSGCTITLQTLHKNFSFLCTKNNVRIFFMPMPSAQQNVVPIATTVIVTIIRCGIRLTFCRWTNVSRKLVSGWRRLQCTNGFNRESKNLFLLIFHIMMIGQKTVICILTRKLVKYTCANK